MNRCSGIKPNGGRCERIVSQEQSYCYSHDPGRQGERQRNAARGGRAKASGEIGRVKANLQALADATLEGAVDKGVAAVTGQIWNIYLSAVRTELKVREIEEIAREVEDLRLIVEAHKGRAG
jgi:hypothetical protein